MTFYLHQMLVANAGEDNDQTEALFWTSVTVVSIVAIMFLFSIYRMLIDNSWKKGNFPQRAKYTRDNMFEAYVCLAGRVLRADRQMTKEKFAYINQYFSTYFRNETYHYFESLKFSMEHPIKLNTVTAWMRMHFSHRQRLQVMYFLAGLVYVDGFMNSRENEIMLELKKLLYISDKDYQSIIGMYEQKRERREKRASKPTESTRNKVIRISCKVLSVDENAAAAEIKKAYRTLVKKHHPDRFAQEGEEQKKIASEKFIEIQKAYEALEELGKV